MTWASGEEFLKSSSIQVFINSIKKNVKNTHVVFLTHDMSQEFEKSLYPFEVIRIPADNVHLIMRDRFLAIHDYLARSNFQYVLLSDCKDVLFQGNPFSAINRENFVWLCDEGLTHKESSWNAMNQVIIQQDVKEFQRDFMDAPVINAGLIMGSRENIKNLSLMIWLHNQMTSHLVSEQGNLNYLQFFLTKDPVYEIKSPFNCNYALTGEAVVQGKITPALHNGQVCLEDIPYLIFHQWDRTDFKDMIHERFEF